MDIKKEYIIIEFFYNNYHIHGGCFSNKFESY